MFWHTDEAVEPLLSAKYWTSYPGRPNKKNSTTWKKTGWQRFRPLKRRFSASAAIVAGSSFCPEAILWTLNLFQKNTIVSLLKLSNNNWKRTEWQTTTWKILVFTGRCTERGDGFVDVIMVEKCRDWYYTTSRKKNSIWPISNTKNIPVTEKLHFLKNYPYTNLKKTLQKRRKFL